MEIREVELIGQRAKLVPLHSSHISGLFEAGRSGDIWTYMPRKVGQYQDMVSLVEEALKEKDKGTSYPFVVIDQVTGKIVGSTRYLDISIPNRNLEIGWTWLSPGVWRRSINTECKYLLLRHCFETLGTIRVQLKADARNTRSCTAIERIGAKKEGVLRKNRIMYDGYVRDTVYFSILQEEWPGVKSNLEEMLSY